MGDDKWELLRVTALGLALALATVFIPELMLSLWSPSTPDSHGAVQAPQPAPERSFIALASLPAGLARSGCRHPHDRALQDATVAILHSALTRKPAGMMGGADPDQGPACACESSSSRRTSVVPADDGSLPCAAPP